MKTTIKLTGEMEVTINAIDPLTGEAIEWVYWTPRNGGYIRQGATHSANDPQVCTFANNTGNTLTADDADELLATIRAEWAAYRKWAKTA